MYQQIRLSDASAVGAPGPLPQNLVGLSDAALADISAAIDPPPPGLAGQGFWPVTLATPPYDPRAQVPDDTYAVGKPDAGARSVSATANLRDLTAAEIAALPPVPVCGDAIIGAIAKADRAKCDPTDLARIAWRDDVPAGNAKLARIAKALNTTPDALRQAATA